MRGVYQALGPRGFGTYEVEQGTQGRLSFRLVVDATAETMLIPGFVDVHIHGAFGIDFMGASTSEMVQLCELLRAGGYEGFLPTTVTASAEAVSEALAHLPEHPMILGFHLEGPFISDRYPGAQPQEFIQRPPAAPSVWDAILDHPKLRVATIAPELAGADRLIPRLAQRGVKVGMGHTNATYQQAQTGAAAGATHTTHTYNAMRPFHHREAGTVGYAFQDDQLACELIYDRLHVCKEAAALLLRCKPPDKIIGISDGTKAAGLQSGTALDMWGLDAVVGEGEVRLTDGTLAGSAVTLKQVFFNLLADFGPEIAIRACCLNPRNLLGLTGEPRVWLEVADGEIVQIHDGS